jgi:hypothetical protein
MNDQSESAENQQSPPSLQPERAALSVVLEKRARDYGTPEWFKREKLHLIEHAKAVDSFGAAARSFQKIVDLGVDGDAEIRAALHTAGVVHYARPFSNNRSGTADIGLKVQFAKRIIKDHPKYDAEIHRQLIDLRDKLIAHSDADYADGRLFRKTLHLSDGLEQRDVLAGACLVTQTVHLLNDMALADRYLAHANAAGEAASAKLAQRLERFVQAGREYPDAMKTAAKADPPPPIAGPRFNVSPENRMATVPVTLLNPHAVLTRPPLTIGGDGYAYRGFALGVDVSAELRWRGPDWSETAIAWGHIDASRDSVNKQESMAPPPLLTEPGKSGGS